MENIKKKTAVAVCLVIAVLGSYFLIRPHGFIRYVTDSAFEYIEVDGGIILTKYIGDSKDIIVPAKIDGKSVLSLKGAFCGDTSVRNVRLSEGIVSVDYMTFWHCVSLESVDLPDSLETVGHAAFEGCVSLEKVRLGKNLTDIMPYAFGGCQALKSVDLPECLRFIGEKAFDGCVSLGEVFIPSSVEIIGGVTPDKKGGKEEIRRAYSEQIGETDREAFSNCGKIKIEIDSENPHYKIENGKITSK